MNKKSTRRQIIFSGMAFLGAILTNNGCQRRSTSQVNQINQIPSSMPERILGNTGIKVPIFGLGGAGKTPLSRNNQEAEAIALIEAALRGGIRYFDTAASYGPSESYLGKVLPNYRKNVLIATKTAARDRDGAWRELETSLKRLNTDYLDFWQLHHVSFPEEIDNILSQNGAIKAIEEAKEQKIIRFSGITGHHEPNVIVEALERYPFDTTLISINAADIHHPRPFSSSVLPVAQAKNVGVITMKIPAYGRLFQPGILTGMEQAMGYTLSLKGVHCCIIAAENVAQLEANIKVAQAFQELTLSEMKEIENLTAKTWEDTTFFRRWT
jgi:aryl-alcohol dehydrogenase-like predicted oxidoreductase